MIKFPKQNNKYKNLKTFFLKKKKKKKKKQSCPVTQFSLVGKGSCPFSPRAPEPQIS